MTNTRRASLLDDSAAALRMVQVQLDSLSRIESFEEMGMALCQIDEHNHQYPSHRLPDWVESEDRATLFHSAPPRWTNVRTGMEILGR